MAWWRQYALTGMALLAGWLLAEQVGAQALPADETSETVWPNKESHANSDDWLRLHHDRLREMRPRVLVLNFVNGLPGEQAANRANQLVAALRESSRYHGYKRADAPAFLNYKIFKVVNITDPEVLPEESRLDGNSSLYPRVPDWKEGMVNFQYGDLFTEKFAEYYQVSDPGNPGRLLTLEEMVKRGIIHEVWFLALAGRFGAPHACAEVKQAYDAQLRKIPGRNVQAGSGNAEDQPFLGRSLRILWINSDGGPGCALENLSYGLEGLANSRAIPYLTRYFQEFRNGDMKKRYRTPFENFDGREPGSELRYTTEGNLIYKYKGEEFAISKYVASGGSIRYHPAARREYDLDSPAIVQSSIENYRQRNGLDGRDKAEPWSIQKYARYRQLAVGCQGPWLVYMRQNMPGLDNRARDDQDRPMKNWWPFLFY